MNWLKIEGNNTFFDGCLNNKEERNHLGALKVAPISLDISANGYPEKISPEKIPPKKSL